MRVGQGRVPVSQGRVPVSQRRLPWGFCAGCGWSRQKPLGSRTRGPGICGWIWTWESCLFVCFKLGLETANMTFLIETGERKFKWFLEHIEREWCAF